MGAPGPTLGAELGYLLASLLSSNPLVSFGLGCALQDLFRKERKK